MIVMQVQLMKMVRMFLLFCQLHLKQSKIILIHLILLRLLDSLLQ